jgi:plastocyanin
MKKFLVLCALIFAVFRANADTVIVKMTRFNTFDPANITINIGDTVIWTNTASVQHDTVAFDGTWHGPLLNLHQTFSFTFGSAGSHDYFCTPHLDLGMVGNVTVVGGAVNNAPTATINSPANNANFLTSDTINVQVGATDDNGVTKVELLVDGNVAQTSTQQPFQFSLTLPAGSHTLAARATDAGGLTGTSQSITINVGAPNQPPTVTLDAPANNSVFTAPASLNLEASANDDNGVDHVEFFVNDVSVGVDATVSYSIPQTLNAGTYRIRAVAVDASGLTATSSEATIQVNERVLTAPTISIISPAKDVYITFPSNVVTTNVTLIARATDLDGSIAKVEFSEGTNFLGVATAVPATNLFQLVTPLPEGRVTITARATDNDGKFTTSDPVSFTLALQPKFTSRTLLTNGVMRLSVFGTSAVPFVFDYSDDMKNWTPFLTNVLYRRILFFDDATANGSTNRSYRARSPDAP